MQVTWSAVLTKTWSRESSCTRRGTSSERRKSQAGDFTVSRRLVIHCRTLKVAVGGPCHRAEARSTYTPVATKYHAREDKRDIGERRHGLSIEKAPPRCSPSHNQHRSYRLPYRSLPPRLKPTYILFEAMSYISFLDCFYIVFSVLISI